MRGKLSYRISPEMYDYIMRLRAETAKQQAEFHQRRQAAIAKAAVEEQGVGE